MALASSVVLVGLAGCGVEHAALPDAPDAGAIPSDAWVHRVDAARLAGRDAGRDAAAALDAWRAPPEPLIDCLGHATEPAGGAPIALDTYLTAGGGWYAAAFMDVCFCSGNVLSPEALAPSYTGTCGAGCQYARTDDFGRTHVDGLAGGWYAYRVFACVAPVPTQSIVDTVRIDESTPTTDTYLVLTSLMENERANLTAGEPVPTLAGTSILSTTVHDCHRATLSGVVLRVFDLEGTELLDTGLPTDPRTRYVIGGVPLRTAPQTDSTGAAVVINLDPSLTQLRAEAWQAGTRISCELATIPAGGIGEVSLGPLRVDYPAGHPCVR